MDLQRSFVLMKQGAEAKVYAGKFCGRPAVLKERFEKKYRHPVLDAAITKDRIKAETRAIMRCKAAGISTPALYLVNGRYIIMEHVEGIMVKEYIKTLEGDLQNSEENTRETIHSKLQQLGNDIGVMVGCLHASNIIHGDLTTSNILMREGQTLGNDDDGDDKSIRNIVPRAPWQKLVLIDFGLSKMDPNAEDKGVDLYVLERALSSTHPHVGENIIFPAILKGYAKKGGKSGKDVLSKFEEVRMRGRKRTMVG